MSRGTPPGINRILEVTWYKQNLDFTWYTPTTTLPWYRRRIPNNTASACWCRTRRRHPPWDRATRYTTWNSLESDGSPLRIDAAPLLLVQHQDSRIALSAAILPGIPWNRTALRQGSTLPHSPWYNTRTLGFHIPRCSRLKEISIPFGVVCFSENSFIPPHGFTSQDELSYTMYCV